jgi:WD40-like Beta Propeller Repeat
MCRPTTWGLLLLLGACEARISGAPGDPVLADAALPGDDAAIDAATDATVMLGPWLAPAKVPQASTPSAEDDVTLSSNALEMVFAIDGGTNGKDLYYTSRPSTAAPWAAVTRLPFNTGTLSDETPRFSADDKTLFFASDRVTKGNLDIYSVTHPAPDSMSWGSAQVLTTASTTASEKWYMPCGTRYMMVQSTASNGTDLVEGPLGGTATPVALLNSAQSETGTFLTPDCLTLYFASARTTPQMIYKSTRPAVTAPWSNPTPVVDFAMVGGNQEDPWLSPDLRTFAFASDAAGTGNKDVYLSTR